MVAIIGVIWLNGKSGASYAEAPGPKPGEGYVLWQTVKYPIATHGKAHGSTGRLAVEGQHSRVPLIIVAILKV